MAYDETQWYEISHFTWNSSGLSFEKKNKKNIGYEAVNNVAAMTLQNKGM